MTKKLIKGSKSNKSGPVVTVHMPTKSQLQQHNEDKRKLKKHYKEFYGMPDRLAGLASTMTPSATSIGMGINMAKSMLTGSGDYRVTSNACIVPGFKNSDSTVITHREYITDIKTGALSSGSSVFDIQKFPLQPGDTSTFPWLATIASNYEEYDIQGMVFAYVATSGESVASTNTALGTVIMATEYDPTKPDFVNKQAMENYSFATSAKPSVNQLHAVECAKVRTPVKQLYVRNGTVAGTDIRWSDFGNFYIATVGCPAAGTTIGELWVTYKVKLIKPRLPITVGYGGQIATGRITRSGAATANPVGTATTGSSGPLPITVTAPNLFAFKATPNMDYLVTINHFGTGFTTLVLPTIVSGAAFINEFNNKTTPYAVAITATTQLNVAGVTCTNTDTDGLITMAIGLTAGTGVVDIIVTQLDETA